MFELGISRILKFVLIIETIFLLCNSVTISRDYQDTWILEGLEVPFTVFIVTYLFYFYTEKKVFWLIVFVLIFRFTVLAIPNLKYPWFQGWALDQHFHYRLSQDIYDQGYIRTGDLYTGTAFMHLSFVIYSIITRLKFIQSFKFFPILAWLVFPILTYVFTNRIRMHRSVQRYALLVSSIPAKPAISYIVIGTLFGPLLMFLILYHLIVCARVERLNLIIIIIYSFSLAYTHSFSSIAFIILLIVMFVIWEFLKHIRYIYPKHELFPKLTLTIIVFINSAWYLYISTAFVPSIKDLSTSFMKTMGIIEAPWLTGFFHARFFEIGFLDQLRVLLAIHGADLFLMLLTLIGISVIYNKIRMQGKSELMSLSLYITSLILFFIFGYILDIGMNWYDRTIRLFLIVTPIFAGISLQFIEAKMRNKLIPIFIVGLFLLFSTIEIYRCQPLIPSAKSLSKDLPDDEPLTYLNMVNTIYQRDMILYAEKFFPHGKNIASDVTTARQMYGLTSINFSQAHMKYYPLSKKKTRLKFDYFLIHLPGKSGGFEDPVETRTTNVILSTIYNSRYNIIYTNSESYILSTR